MLRPSVSPLSFLLLLSVLLLVTGQAYAQPVGHAPTSISSGAEASRLAQRITNTAGLMGSPVDGNPILDRYTTLGTYLPGTSFQAYNFDDNATLNGGYVFIPPDPIGAAGTDRVIAVVNCGIECRNKTGTMLWRSSLQSMFSSVSTMGTATFDPKIVYDHYENRFVVVTLERWFTSQGDPSDASRILLAVSKTSTPATATTADWWMFEIDSKINIGGFDHWADYPGFEIDEEVIYITNNMFPFSSGGGGVRLWIVDKGVVGGFYAGSTPVWNVYNPIPAGFFNLTTQPALVFGTGGAGINIGTYLVGYSSLTYGGPGGIEVTQIIRVDTPASGSATFTGQLVNVGDIEDVGGSYGYPAIPDAPQLGTAYTIEVNDSRALDAVWRNNKLYFTTTINPNTGYDATNNGQATAHWFKYDTTTPASITLLDQGNIGGEDIATGTWTFFPAIAVNGIYDVAIGFSACASTIWSGAYYAHRQPTDPAGSIGASQTVQAGLDWYYRAFGGTRNRWGDYSGAAVDPSDDTTFWIFNEYAMLRGTPISGEDGRWATAWAQSVPQQPQTLDWGDAPDPTYPTLNASGGANHVIVQNIFLGALIDAEPDGIPHPTALGDDLTNLPDEDGVVWPPFMGPGGTYNLAVTASVPGWVDVWIDLNIDGFWTVGELVYSGPVVAGLNNLPFTIPVGSFIGQTFARVRYNTGGPLPVGGAAPDGEVEDYAIVIEEQVEVDWGDAPDQPYPTLAASTGANHTIVQGIFLGALIDAEPDGQPDPNAMGDDNNNQPDEDGVNWVTPLVPGGAAQVDVIPSVPGWVDAWVDFNANGVWEASEQIYSGAVTPPMTPIPYNVPNWAVVGFTFARVRYNTVGPLPVTGGAVDGEVEDYELWIDEPQTLDWGDAPDPTYQTLAVNNGPNHTIVPGIFMGAQIDGEPDGQPDPNAMGDDNNNLADEDGVTVIIPPAPGSPCQIDVTVSVAGRVDLWIDFDLDGLFTNLDLMWSGSVVPGLNSLTFGTPLGAQPGAITFMRVRYNTVGPLPPTGPAQDGEVEDYEIRIEELTNVDFGDAPDPTYPTLLLSDGARHNIVPGVFMGTLIDWESDGLQDPNAQGDDINNLADEDGVVWATAIIPTLVAQMDVTCSVPGWVDAWIDFDQNGVWDPTDLIYSGPVIGGLNPILFPVPATAVLGQAFARIRFNQGVALPVTGYAVDGEVEDYLVDIDELIETDWGDAPDPTYPTWASSGGANHIIVPGVYMGASVDAELDGQPTPYAMGDDVNNTDDEDGVVWSSPLIPGVAASMTVTASVNGWVDAWIDFDKDGTWTGGESIYSGNVVAGANVIPFTVLGRAVPDTTFARVRFNSGGVAYPPTGGAPDGEVEDYLLVIEEPLNLDFGDAPDPGYPTLRPSNGARHNRIPGVRMGALIDLEPNGIPDPNARGDDLANFDDEDGVVWSVLMVPGGTAQADVTVSVAGWVDIWVDFNQNGSWADAGELVTSVAVTPGVNNLTYSVPASAILGNTFARVRYNTIGALAVDGYSVDGEVEDYEVWVHSSTSVPGDGSKPFGIRMGAPNPFSQQFAIEFAIPAQEYVELKVFNMQGQLVTTLVNEDLPAGAHSARWNGRGSWGQQVPSGIYFYRLRAGDLVETRKVIYAR